MVELYVVLIINGRRKFSSIREELRNDVERRLRELGYDTNGKELASEE